MTPTHIAINSWRVNYKGVTVCYIRIAGASEHWVMLDARSWIIQFEAFNPNSTKGIIDDDFKQIIWDNINYCRAAEKKIWL